MTVNLSCFAGAGAQFFSNAGVPLSGGMLYTYQAGTTTPATTYTTSAGNVANSNPIVLDAAGRTPQEIWLTAGSTYKFVLKDSGGATLGTYDNIPGANDYTSLSGPNGSALIGFIQAGSGAVATTAQAKMRQIVSVIDFGADPTGTNDSGTAFRNAIASLPANGGGIYVPDGTYKVTAAVGDTSNTAIYVPSGVRIYGSSQVGVKIVAGASNTVIFRVVGLNGGIDNVQILGNGYSNVSGIRLAPIDETQTTQRSDVEFNVITNISIRSLQEAIVLKCGPRVGGQDSYCYYNKFVNIDIRNCVLGIWLKIPNGGDPGSGCNRNQFVNVRCGEAGSNTGLQIDAGDTNTFVGLSFEGIYSGTAPSATPTAIVVDYNSGTYSCTDNKFYGLTIEGCTRSVSNKNDLLEFYGYYDATSTYNVPPPAGALPLAVDMSRGYTKSLQTIGTQYLGRGTAALVNVVDLQLDANGQGIVGRDVGTNANQYWAVDIAKGGGAYSYTALKYNNQPILTWGGSLTTYNEVMRVRNPSNGNFYLGQNDTDRVFLNSTGFQPASDNTFTLGSASYRWSVVYAGNGTINTSDEREKDQIQPIDDAVLRAWSKVNYSQYKFKDAVAKKGNGARWHIGLVAQRVKEAFESEGLDAFAYGLLCYDEWQDDIQDVLEEFEVTLEDGTVVKGAKPTGEKRVLMKAGNRYGIRYEEALALEAAYLRSQVEKLLAK